MDENDLLALRQRLGDDYLGRRLRAQVDRSLRIKGQGQRRAALRELLAHDPGGEFGAAAHWPR